MKLVLPKAVLILFLIVASNFLISRSNEDLRQEESLSKEPTENNWFGLKEGESIASVTAVLAVPDTFYIVPLREIDLKSAGCSYSTQDSNKVSALLKIFNSATLREKPNENKFWENRSAVYFETNNGHVLAPAEI